MAYGSMDLIYSRDDPFRADTLAEKLYLLLRSNIALETVAVDCI